MSEELEKSVSLRLMREEQDFTPEMELVKLCGSAEEFRKILPRVSNNLRKIGLDLVRTDFLGQKVYMVMTTADEPPLEPELFGKFICLATLIKEKDATFTRSNLKEIFPEIDKELKILEDKKFIVSTARGTEKVLELGPLGKATLKDTLNLLSVENLQKWAKKQ